MDFNIRNQMLWQIDNGQDQSISLLEIYPQIVISSQSMKYEDIYKKFLINEK